MLNRKHSVIKNTGRYREKPSLLFLIRSLVSMGLIAGVSACSSTGDNVSDARRLERLQADIETIFAGQEPIDRPVSLAEAIARALKYNLDARVKRMEEVLSRDAITTAQLDLLPELVADAGYNIRNPQSGSSSRSLLTNRESLSLSTSTDKRVRTADLALSWSLLDFGMAYVRSHQAGNEHLITEERRRKTIHNIVLDVRDVYWKAVSAQKNLRSINQMIRQIYVSLHQAHKIYESRLESPRVILGHQKELLQALNTLTNIRRELEMAHLSLAVLMNVRPTENFRVLEDEQISGKYPRIEAPVPLLETTALLDRPELRERDYQKQIEDLDVKKVMWSLLPGVSAKAGGHYTSNSFAAYPHWWAASVSLTKNIFEIFSFPWRYEAAENAARLADIQRMAMRMAVIAQVNISHKRYLLAEEIYFLSRRVTGVSETLRTLTRNQFAAQTTDQFESVRNEVGYILASLQQDLAYADLQNAYGRVLNSIGLDFLPDQIESLDIETLTRHVQTSLDAWQTINVSQLQDAQETAILSDVSE